jgi:hypothetical protein
MNKPFIISMFIGLLLMTSGCSATTPGTSEQTNISASNTPPVPSSAATFGAVSAVPSPQSAPTRAVSSALEDGCGLLNSRDLAGFFPPHVETRLPKPQLNQVDHPIFSDINTPGTETSCIYYTFYHPGSITMVMLQTTYWVDIPASAVDSQAWAQAWSEASSRALRTVSDIADGAFYNNGRLSFKEGNMYVTVEAIETDWSLDSSATMDKQFALEKQIALDLLNHLM